MCWSSLRTKQPDYSDVSRTVRIHADNALQPLLAYLVSHDAIVPWFLLGTEPCFTHFMLI